MRSSRHLVLITLALVAGLAGLVISASSPHASVRPEDRDRIGRPELVAPALGERVPEAAVRFAFRTPRDAARALLLIAKQPFDPSSWKEIPSLDHLMVRDASKPILSLAELGVAVDADTPFWWAIAVIESGTGRLRVSEVRSFLALRKFTNRVTPSPYLLPGRVGKINASELIGATGSEGANAAGPPRIRLFAGYDFAPAEGEPAVPTELSSRVVPESEAGGLRSYLIQFDHEPSAPEMAAITRSGGSVYAYIPDQAYLVRMSESARRELEAESKPAWVGDYQPAYKISPLVDREAAGSRAHVALLFPDVEVGAASAALRAQGLTVVKEYDNGINKMVRFVAPAAAINGVAALPGVAWIEPALKMELLNDQAQWVVQTNSFGNRRVWDMGIRGQGQVVNTSDSGIEVTHDQFRDNLVPIPGFGDYPTHRKIIAYKSGSDNPVVQPFDHAGANYHGTHTAGSIAGSDDPNGGTSTRDGMAKEAKIYFMDVSGTQHLNGVDPFGDLNDLFLPPYVGNAGGAARVSSHSWGGDSNGAYTIQSLQTDQFMWAHKDFFVSFANGNAGPAKVGAPASAKNSVGAGATANGVSTAYASFTSRGPTSDGRRKPTYCTPGSVINSASGGAPNLYVGLQGTSMASPIGAGAIALVRQYLTDGWYPTGAPVPANGFSPSAALLKAMGINSAAETAINGFTAPDQNVGWGKLNIDNVLYFAGDARKLLLVDNNDGLGVGQFIEYQVNVVDGSQPLEITLCWTDFPGHPTAAVTLVNNLDLTVSQGATVYRGNVYTGQYSTTGGSYDDRNVEENVRIQTPAAGLWTVRVAAPAVPMGLQPFGLCITGGVGNGAGALALDRAEYGSTSTIEIQVIDANAGASVNVSLLSDTEPTGETVTLNGGNGIYNGSLPLSPLVGSVGDGTLTVSNGDAITATYQDANPATTLTTQAQVNFDTPVITNVTARSQGPAGTLVTWNTDRNATSHVYYGLTPALELGLVTASGANTSHQVLIANLTPGATYYYDVESVSLSGSLARDDLGGAHHRFTAKTLGDILMVFGENPHVRAFGWENALQANGYDYDLWVGPLAENPMLGDLSSGMRAYRAVLWQPGLEQYPPVGDAQRPAIENYLAGGGRFAISGHDICWAMGDPSSPFYTPDRQLFLENVLKTTYQSDPATWSVATGYAGDPISGAYSGGTAYSIYRAGGAGDEVDIAASAGGTVNYVWRNNDASPDDVGFRWESGAPNGSGASALWGGLPSRLVNMFFEFTGLGPPVDQPSAIRNDVLEKTLVWLFGRPHPTVQITAPNGAEVLTGNSTMITWNETVGSGRVVATRALEYSTDDGASWNPIASGVGPSPYAWDLSGLSNTGGARVRIRVTDDGSPSLRALDASDASFTLNRAGADTQGPVVVPGSIAVDPNPIVRPNSATLEARVSDLDTGAGPVAQAEWSIGAVPATAGTGTTMSGAFGTTTVEVSVVVASDGFADGTQKLWVRGRDGAGNWGPAAALAVLMNGQGVVGVGTGPRVTFLAQNTPNPFTASTVIDFSLAASGPVTLGIFDVQGRLVRTLVERPLEAGRHSIDWDGRNDVGARVGAGVYYYRLLTPAARFEKRLVTLD